MFDLRKYSKARLAGPGAGDSAPPHRRTGRANLLAALAVLLCVGFAANSALAAALAISIQIRDVTNAPGSPTTIGPTAIGSGFSVSGLAVGSFTASVASMASLAPTVSDLETNTIDLNNNGASPSTLEVIVSVQNYNLPSGPILGLSSSASGTSSAGLAGQVAILQSYADAGNSALTLVGTPTGPQTGVLPGSTPPTQTYNFGATANLQTTFVRGPGDFSITQVFLITLDAGKKANLTLSTAIAEAPVPSTAGLGVVLLGGLSVGGLRRLNGRRILA